MMGTNKVLVLSSNTAMHRKEPKITTLSIYLTTEPYTPGVYKDARKLKGVYKDARKLKRSLVNIKVTEGLTWKRCMKEMYKIVEQTSNSLLPWPRGYEARLARLSCKHT